MRACEAKFRLVSLELPSTYFCSSLLQVTYKLSQCKTCNFVFAQRRTGSTQWLAMLMQEAAQADVQAPARSQTGTTNQWDHDLQPVKVSGLQSRSLALYASRKLPNDPVLSL